MTEEQVFLAALDIPERPARTAYLDKVCGTDTEFRQQVEDLLDAHFKTGEFLNQPLGQQLGVSAPTSNNDNTISVRYDPDGNPVAPEAKAENEMDDLSFLEPTSRADALGRLGHYEILQVLGKGGFGIVFRALDDVLRRVVALKVLAPSIAATSPARRRFVKEAQASARVRHENIVQIHGVDEGPLPYLVMEFIPGETLQQRLDRIGPLQAPEVVRIARQVAEGLAAAHETGLIHRDIKPGNVLIEKGPQERVKITDFGLARAADDASTSQSGMLAGTPMYMAPEQAKGDTLDHRVDLFSLGSVMYVMASGRPPFRAATTYAVLKRVVEEEPRAIHEIMPEVPQWLCDIIKKLQSKNPDDRFASAREVADLLARCEAGQIPEFADKPASVEQSAALQPSPPSRSYTGAWLAAAVVLLPLMTLSVTELAGWTRLFREEQAGHVPINPDPNQVAKNDPKPVGPASPDKTPPETKTPWIEVKATTPEAKGPPFAVAPFDGETAKKHQHDWANFLDVPIELGPTPEKYKFRLIPPGTFRMGDDGHGKNERPAHDVNITRPFYLAIHEVTVAQFRQFVNEDKYVSKAESNGKGSWGIGPNPNGKGVAFVPKAGINWRTRPAKTTRDDHPVTCMAWSDAVAYCAWLSKKEGKSYRLPTEAEWEYACRAGTTTAYYWGDGMDKLKANLGREYKTPVQVGYFAPNPFGICEMHGNVGEWCLDAPRSYGLALKNDPIGSGNARVYRGGQWFSQADSGNGRSSDRHYTPGAGKLGGIAPADVPMIYAGFRVVLELPTRTDQAANSKKSFSDADVQRIAALPAKEQIEAVRQELMRINPGFDGKLESTIENGVVTHLQFTTDHVADITPVRALANLRSLECIASNVFLGSLRADALAPLRGLPLTNLSFRDSPGVNDLSSLKEMKLTRLDCRHTNVGDEDLKNLTGMTSLQTLNLWFTSVTDEGMKEVATLKNLQNLSIQTTAVTDEGLQELLGLDKLLFLDLYNVTEVTDAGLDHLARIKSLKVLDLRGTKSTDAGAEKLAAVLPGIRINAPSGRIIESK